ncbi:MAG: hypothetical protein K2Q01_00115, partial [Rickettsiales bacterium]|nr:hypothetical protein [Rickettsiales bacterium]
MKRFLLLLAALLASPALADTQSPRPGFTEADVPETLRTWSKWALAGYTPNPCPFLYNNNAQKECVWPGELALKLTPEGGEFQMKATLYDEGWLTLPGSEARWPKAVKLGGQNLIVSSREGRPAVFLASGSYSVTGSFDWPEMPENLLLPQALGALKLEVAGKAVAFPSLDAAGTLWVKRKESEATEAERMDVKIFRRLTDSIPARISTRLVLHVAGKPREMLLGAVLPQGFSPLNVTSEIPARIEP